MLTSVQIACIAYTANRALCGALNEPVPPDWFEADKHIQLGYINGVLFRRDNSHAPVSAQHEQRLNDKYRAGYSYGPFKDDKARTHPCMVPFERLPAEQQAKDRLFVAIVNALLGVDD